MVQQEVMCCMSHLVSTIASGYGLIECHERSGDPQPWDLQGLSEQAFELSSPIPDYEEAATQAGWNVSGEDDVFVFDHDEHHQSVENYPTEEAAWEACCMENNIEPYEWEVFEHWAVSTWLAEKLIEQGERVDTDFGGLNVWARTCSGQGIASDGVVERIYKDMVK